MCQFFIPIAQLDEHCLISQCEHATVSLTWWNCTWHLQPNEFLALFELVQKGEGQHQCFVLEKYDDKYMLWCGDACLLLKPQRWQSLKALICRAAPLIETDPDRAYRKATMNAGNNAGHYTLEQRSRMLN